MSLREMLDILRRSRIPALATTMIGVLAAIALSAFATPVYQAQSQLFVSVQTAEEISGAYTGELYVQQRLDSYATLVDTPAVLEPVIEEVNLAQSYTDLAKQVSAQNPSGTVLLNVYASSVEPEPAAKIADATAESLAAEIVRLETTQSGAQPVKVELIQPAQVPDDPVSPRTSFNIVLGFLLGLGAAVGISLLRYHLDTTIKSPEDLQSATHATLLGTVAHDPHASKSPLALSQSSRSEAYRTLRTNLKYVDVDDPPRCVVITSSMPFEGKSTTAVNLAIALAGSGSNVLLVEADLRRPKVAEYLGVDGSIGLTDVLIGRAVLGDVIIPWGRGLMDFLPSGAIPPNPSELLGSQQLADLLTKLRSRYDFLVVDAPPLLPVTDAAILTAVADGAILVARFGQTRREQAEQAVAALAGVAGRLIGTVLNFMPAQRGIRQYDYGYGQSGPSRSSKSSRQVLTDEEVAAPPQPN